MEGPVLRLSPEDLWRASAEIDPAELLTGGAAGRLRPVPGTAGEGGQVLLEDRRLGVRCLFPEPALGLAQAAALVALGTRGLLTPEEPTVALLAPWSVASWYLAALASHVPGISHVALCPVEQADDPGGVPPAGGIDPRTADLLDEAGVALSVVEAVSSAVVGATLVIAAGPAHEELRFAGLALGALVINAVGRDLPDDLVDHVDQVYVDDFRLLAENGHRHFVKLHQESGDRPPVTVPEREGWHQPAAWPGRRRVEADLVSVLAGEHRGRARRDDVLLCELFGTRVPNVVLACRLARVALTSGLGVLVSETPQS
jgi:hypothetical protein